MVMTTVDGYLTGMTTASVRLPGRPDVVAAGRAILTTVLQAWQVPPRHVEDVALLVTELASNAVRNAPGAFTITVDARETALRVAVHDSSPVLPQPVHAGPEDEAGRGLLLVEALATRWGSEPTRNGKLVWFEIAPD